ncbi:DMT family transporter [Paracoccus sp. (in: a-proteobacteria)]|uniref:DMT family transporter n=1 Tax=Paracoccus sp. TaxID=267 RepID=UPI0026E024C9|nr:DMT family transporter [Paracoccus sp. (in: a-proteobacteria)]MDO5370242.1 DMT family transporter [Paracoccus sp. (in: a-proteobacteria)]
MWIAATLIAALAQTGRNAAQAGLTSRIGTMGATGVRFLFGLPFALLFLGLVALVESVPPLNAAAFGYAALGALSQVAATALMLTAMQRRGFAVATALIKTEPVTLAIMGAALLAEPLPPARLGAIALATAGVLAMSGTGWRRAGAGPVALAVLAGGLFGLSAIGFRGAILSLPSGGELMRATTILVLSLALQTALVGGWLALRDRAALRGMGGAWRESLGAGFLGALASQFWFLAFALAPAANVRTLALVEVVFAAAVSRSRREALGAPQIAGMALIVAGVGWLLWTAR